MAAEQRFAWKGTDRHGKAAEGVLRAADAGAATVALRRQGILATRVQAARAAPGGARSRPGAGGRRGVADGGRGRRRARCAALP